MADKPINVLKNRKLSLEGARLVGSGAASSVYQLPNDDVVKVLLGTDFKEAEREILLSKWVFLKGIPTAISYDVVDVDGHPGLLYESLGRDNLRNQLRDHANDLTPLLEKYLELIRSINAIEVEEGQLPSAKQHALKEIQEIKAVFSEDEFARITTLFDTIPEDCHMVHGDCHIKNIKIVNGKPFLIDLDTLSVGDPIFELSGLCCCYDAYSALNLGGDGFNEFFGVEDRIIRETYHYILDHYSESLSDADKKSNLKKIELLTYLHMLHELNPDDPDEKGLYDDMFRKVRERLNTVPDLVLKR